MAGWKSPSENTVLGKPTPRLDGPAKVTGRAKYAYDVQPAGLLQGKILRCPHGSAQIISIDTSAAERMPGVGAVIITAKPGDIMRFAGQELGGVAAKSFDIAQDAVRAIKVSYKVLPHVVHEEAAMKPDAPNVRGADPNTSTPNTRSTGDTDAAFQSAAAVIEGTYSCAVRTHNSLETHGTTCKWEDDTHLTCWASTQGVFSVRDDFAREYKLPPANIHVITEVMGGGFGSKFGAGYEGILCANLAKKANAPVKLMLNREEEQIAVGNAPSATVEVRMAADGDGNITAVDAKLHGTGGISGAGVPFPYIYKVGSTKISQISVFMNSGGQRAWRAPGHPQASFLMESAVEDLAIKLGMDPLELRMKNDPSKLRISQWREGARIVGWDRRNAKPGNGKLAGNGRYKRGLGCGAATWGGGGGGGSQCKVIISNDGSVDVEIGVQDIGTGTRTYCAMIVAEELGLAVSAIKTNLGKTSLGYGVGSGGSVTTGSTAPAVKRAAEAAKEALVSAVAAKMGVDTDQIELIDGKVIVKGESGKQVPFKKACSALGPGGVTGDGKWDASLQQNGVAGVQFAEVQVDTLTGLVKVIKVVALQDGGVILNPLTFTSQVNGGVIQGIGMALFEDRKMCQLTGRMLNANMEDYKMPGSMEMPEFVSIAFENPTAKGVSGIGEPPVIPTAAAIRNAVLNASGAALYHAPMTPGRVLDALAAGRKG